MLQFTPCGLVLDACGVLLLGFSFFMKGTEAMIQESGTTWDSEAYISVAAGKCDGVFGSTLLFLGFVYQILGYLGVHSEIAVVATWLVLIVFLLAYFVSLRKRLIDKWVADIQAKLS